jgi:hypothetical protein
MLSLHDDQMLETCVFLSLIVTHLAPTIHKTIISSHNFHFAFIITISISYHQCIIILPSVSYAS